MCRLGLEPPRQPPLSRENDFLVAVPTGGRDLLERGICGRTRFSVASVLHPPRNSRVYAVSPHFVECPDRGGIVPSSLRVAC